MNFPNYILLFFTVRIRCFVFSAKMNCLFRTVFHLICIARAAPRRRSRRRFRRFVWFTHCCFPTDFVGSMSMLLLLLLLLRCQRQLHVSALFCILRAAIAGECCCAACDAPTSSPTQLRAGSANWPQGIARVCGWESVPSIRVFALWLLPAPLAMQQHWAKKSEVAKLCITKAEWQFLTV